MIKIIAVGKIKEKALKSLIDEYVQRITQFSKINIIEVNDEPIPKNAKEAINEKIKNIEGENILRHISDDEFVYLLDLHGKDYSSEVLSKNLNDNFNITSKITFVIGGSLGLSSSVVNRANIRWKLSSCTFPHQIVRLLVVEQIYRLLSIKHNLPYHK